MENSSKIKEGRLKKIKRILAMGIEPYPRKTKRTNQIGEALKGFSNFQKKAQEIIIVGRIRGIRAHGGATFFDIEDNSGKIQALLRTDRIGAKGYKFFQEIMDIGDFIEVKGIPIKTKTKEKTIEVDNFTILAKSLLPLPDKWHGLQDIEERYRKRYLDLIFSKDVKKKFELRSQIISALRNFLEKNKFLEVETPTLQPIYGGARARPFKTRLNALNMDLYLRISPELYLKRLLVGGFEKVYEIGKCFRNEGMDKFHNPDFTMLEFYWAFADDKDLMKLTESLFGYILKKIFKTLKIKYQKQEINFKPPFKRIDFSQLLRSCTKINFEEINQRALYIKALSLGIKIEKERPKAEIADEIYKKICRPKIIQPTFIIHHPVGFQLLAKKLKENPEKLANFQLVVGGIELINAFSELNNPIEQKERFQAGEKLRKKGLEETPKMDKDFIQALEYGMPPAAGFGMGIDRLVALLTDSHSLREVILFPIMRQKK